MGLRQGLCQVAIHSSQLSEQCQSMGLGLCTLLEHLLYTGGLRSSRQHRRSSSVRGGCKRGLACDLQKHL